MVFVRTIGYIVYAILLVLIIKRFIKKEKTCFIGNYVFLLGVISYIFAILLFILFYVNKTHKYSNFDLIVVGIICGLLTLVSLVLLAISCNYRLVIKCDCYEIYNIFGLKKKIYFDSIVVKESYYKLGDKARIVLATNNKKYVIKWRFDIGTKYVIDSLQDLKIKIVKRSFFIKYIQIRNH